MTGKSHLKVFTKGIEKENARLSLLYGSSLEDQTLTENPEIYIRTKVKKSPPHTHTHTKGKQHPSD